MPASISEKQATAATIQVTAREGERCAFMAHYRRPRAPPGAGHGCRDRMVATEFRGATPMPSFDVVSEVDTHELTNAIDQANRELATRFDFKGVEAKFEREGEVIHQSAPTEVQLKQMNDILRARLAARGIDVLSLEFGDIETNLAQARQKITVKQGIEQKIAKKIAAALKEAKLKVESQINGDKLRVQGKKRDDLQDAIAVLKAGKFELPLQFNNFRD